MRNWIAAAGLSLLGLTACNTSENVVEQTQAPESPVITMADIMPVVQAKTPQAKAKQEKFLKQNVKRFRSRKLAAAYYVAQAKRTFNEQKLDSAKYLFSRAWLMDSTNKAIYRGYGRIYGQQKEYNKALFILYRALEADRQNPQLLTDIATSHLGRFYETSDPADLQQSKKLLEQAVTLAPDQADTYYKLAINSYYLQEYGKAWRYLHQSLHQDREIADKHFISALLAKQNDPRGIYTEANVQ
ncbi:tetratricopeptide repeat protein [Pontibacter liquoris]|uniref:tetratricopeptide repeat protein n=1 Tax=Pontibacter liquoris TaxID=2905677 RepID=UPI001FA6B1A1|nr:tetratricopeptide repeat protein [Pontibacter liquoris]